jgi:RNA polymerase sigma factor (sigma-70 family)
MKARLERFECIYNANYERLIGYAARRTDRIEDAHDVVSDTFLVAWRRLDGIPDGDRTRLWLYGTARKVVANHHRSRRRQSRLIDRLSFNVSESDLVTPFSDRSGDVEVIARAFSRLIARDQELLVLAGWEELDADQIAEVVGCRPGAVRVRLHRARKRFAAELDAEEDDVKQTAWSGHETGRRASARPAPEEAL